MRAPAAVMRVFGLHCRLLSRGCEATAFNAQGSKRRGSAMKFVLTSWGSRGDVEPCAAVGRELQRRGHEVHVAVPPDLVGFVESVGLAAVAYGLDMKTTMEALRN